MNVLFEEGHYRLEKHNVLDESYLYHRCVGDPDHSWWIVHPTIRRTCPHCGMRPSNDIAGLYYLHNWDR